MKRFCFALALMALSSSAHAGDSFSFVVAGHRIRIEASRHCRSASCVFVSIPGIYRSSRWRDRDDDAAAAPAPVPASVPAPVNPPAAAPAAPTVTRVIQPSIATPASPPPVQPAASAPIPVPTAPAPQPTSTTAKIIVLPAPPPAPAAPDVATTQTITPQPQIAPMKTPAEAPAVVAPKPVPVPTSAPPISRTSQQTEQEPADTPLGDWQTEGNKGTVRVERCGQAVCGYLVNPASDAKGDTILINMKPKSHAVWSGNIYSRSSGATYYSTMTMKGVSTLRVEACALGRFFCSGNDWTRIEKPSKLMTNREISPRPPS
jgi:outer membrane biosynthesis protein TonB